MLHSIIALVLGFVGLILAADKFSDSGASIGTIFNVSPVTIGLVVFGFGTSAPEILVSGFAALSGNNGIGVGNAIGSNIFNITLVLAISALISNVEFSSSILKKEYLFLLILTIILGFLLADSYLSRIDAVILFIIFVGFLYLVFKTSKNTLLEEIESKTTSQPVWKVWIYLVVSLVILLVSAKLVVYGATDIAINLGVSELIIGLTIVSLGTSLPEFALAIASTIKKQHEMLIGNIFGSNIFNSTVVLATVGIINPGTISANIFQRDYLLVLVITLLIFVLSYKKSRSNSLGILGGGVLICILIYYITVLALI